MSRKKTTTQLAIIIPVFNGYSYLEKCLRAIPKASEKTSYKIYAVDNGSEEFERKNFWKEFGNLVDKFYVSDRPLGFPGACNLGATLAKNEKYLLFLNSDCIMSPGSIDIMVDKMKSDQTIGALGPKLVFPSDGNMGKGGTVQHAGLDFDVHGRPTHTFIGWSVDNPKVNKAGEVDALTGASLLIRKNLFEKAKGFDVAYGLGTYEDCDICLNIKEQGFIIYYEPEAVGEHYVGASAKENNIAYPLNNNYYLFASRWGSKIKSKPWTLWRRL